LKNLEKDLNIDQINNLEGNLIVEANLDGIVDFKNDQILQDAGNIKVSFRGVSFELPKTKHIIEQATAEIVVQEEKILIKNLSFKSGNNDVDVQGDITNLIYELSGHDRPIEASFELNSGHLDLKELLSFDTTLAKKFNEIIDDLSLDIKIKTTTDDLDDLRSFPKGEIVIKSLMTDFHTLPDIKDVSGTIVLDEGITNDPKTGTKVNKQYIKINDLKIIAEQSDLQINGSIVTKQYVGTSRKSPASAELSIRSSKLHLKELLHFDTVLSKTYEDEISNLILNLNYDTFLEDIEKKWYLPVGTITFESFTADFEQRWDIKNVTGKLIINEDTVKIADFVGVMGKSDLELSGYINNYPGLFITDKAIHVEMGFHAQSGLMRAKDFFTRRGQFYLPPNFEEEYLKDFNLVADYKFNNLDFFNNTLLPDMLLEISDLNWKTSNTLLDFRDFHIKLIREGKDLRIEDFEGKIGSSDFNFNAEVKNFEPFKDPQFKDLSAHFFINASILDLNELTGIKLANAEKNKSKDPKFNPFDFIYHNLTLDLNVDNLYYDDFIIRSLNGDVHTKRSKEIILDSLSLNTAGGDVMLIAHLDATDPEKVIVTNNLDITNIFIQDMLFGFKFKNDSIQPGEHFKGIVTATIDSKVLMDPKFNIDLENASGTMELVLNEGEIINYPPMQELDKYFGDKDLNNIRIGEISNIIELKDGIITIPRMEVNSTLGYLFFTGTHNFDSNLEYHFEVPFKLITSAAWNMLVNRHREEGTPEDEIQHPTNNETLVSLRLVGNKTDGYHVKLGKGKEGKDSR